MDDDDVSCIAWVRILRQCSTAVTLSPSDLLVSGQRVLMYMNEWYTRPANCLSHTDSSLKREDAEITLVANPIAYVIFVNFFISTRLTMTSHVYRFK